VNPVQAALVAGEVVAPPANIETSKPTPVAAVVDGPADAQQEGALVAAAATVVAVAPSPESAEEQQQQGEQQQQHVSRAATPVVGAGTEATADAAPLASDAPAFVLAAAGVEAQQQQQSSSSPSPQQGEAAAVGSTSGSVLTGDDASVLVSGAVQQQPEATEAGAIAIITTTAATTITTITTIVAPSAASALTAAESEAQPTNAATSIIPPPPASVPAAGDELVQHGQPSGGNTTGQSAVDASYNDKGEPADIMTAAPPAPTAGPACQQGAKASDGAAEGEGEADSAKGEATRASEGAADEATDKDKARAVRPFLSAEARTAICEAIVAKHPELQEAAHQKVFLQAIKEEQQGLERAADETRRQAKHQVYDIWLDQPAAGADEFRKMLVSALGLCMGWWR
jgi:hypothetical protein